MKKRLVAVALVLTMLVSCMAARAEEDSGAIETKYICNLAEAVNEGSWHNNTEIGAILTIFAFFEYTSEKAVDLDDIYDGNDIYVCSSDTSAMEIYLWKPNGHCLNLSTLGDQVEVLFYYDFGEVEPSLMETVMDTCYYKLSASDLLTAINTISDLMQ